MSRWWKVNICILYIFLLLDLDACKKKDNTVEVFQDGKIEIQDDERSGYLEYEQEKDLIDLFLEGEGVAKLSNSLRTPEIEFAFEGTIDEIIKGILNLDDNQDINLSEDGILKFCINEPGWGEGYVITYLDCNTYGGVVLILTEKDQAVEVCYESVDVERRWTEIEEDGLVIEYIKETDKVGRNIYRISPEGFTAFLFSDGEWAIGSFGNITGVSTNICNAISLQYYSEGEKTYYELSFYEDNKDITETVAPKMVETVRKYLEGKMFSGGDEWIHAESIEKMKKARLERLNTEGERVWTQD